VCLLLYLLNVSAIHQQFWKTIGLFYYSVIALTKVGMSVEQPGRKKRNYYAFLAKRSDSDDIQSITRWQTAYIKIFGLLVSAYGGMNGYRIIMQTNLIKTVQ
jgi:hypothetical protein